MNKHTHAATPEHIEQLQLNYAHTYALLQQGDEVTMADILADMDSAGLKEDDLPIMEAALKAYPQYRKALPDPHKDAIFAARLQGNNGLILLQKFFNFWEPEMPA